MTTMADYAPEAFEALHVKPRAGRTLICGSYVTPGKADRRMRYPDALGVDVRPGQGVDVVGDLEFQQFGFFDHIECLSVLEHTRRPWRVADNLMAQMKAGSTIHLSVPFIWRVHDHNGDYYRFTTEAIRFLFHAIEWKALLYGGQRLYKEGAKTRSTKVDGFPFHERCETFGFGVRV